MLHHRANSPPRPCLQTHLPTVRSSITVMSSAHFITELLGWVGGVVIRVKGVQQGTQYTSSWEAFVGRVGPYFDIYILTLDWFFICLRLQMFTK